MLSKAEFLDEIKKYNSNYNLELIGKAEANLDIEGLVSRAVETVPFVKEPTLEQILEADRLARAAVKKR